MVKKRRRKENEERGRKRREEGRGERGDIDGVLHLSTLLILFLKPLQIHLLMP